MISIASRSTDKEKQTSQMISIASRSIARKTNKIIINIKCRQIPKQRNKSNKQII